MSIFLHADFWLSLLVLTVLEIILNADNIIFIVAASSRLPRHQQALARKVGLLVAAVSRVLFLSILFFATTMAAPLFHIGQMPIAINNIVFVLGGLFLIINPLLELKQLRLMKENAEQKRKSFAKFGAVVAQIMFVDIVFSIDNVLTAIGVAKFYLAMIGAIIIAMVAMVIASKALSQLIDKYPKIKVIGLSYLILIGVVLVARGVGYEISSAYIYLSLVFVVFTQGMLAYTRH